MVALYAQIETERRETQTQTETQRRQAERSIHYLQDAFLFNAKLTFKVMTVNYSVIMENSILNNGIIAFIAIRGMQLMVFLNRAFLYKLPNVSIFRTVSCSGRSVSEQIPHANMFSNNCATILKSIECVGIISSSVELNSSCKT